MSGGALGMGSSWWFLLAAGVVELGFTTALRLSNHYTDLFWIVVLSVCAIASLLLLNQASKGIPLGTAYAVWTAMGALGTVIIGIGFFKEPVTAGRLFFLTTLIASVAGLKFVSAA